MRSQYRMHAGHRSGQCGIDAANARMRVRTAHERRVEHPGQSDVVNNTTLATQQCGIFDAARAGADVAGFEGGHCYESGKAFTTEDAGDTEEGEDEN